MQQELAVSDDEGSQFSSLTENVVRLRVVNKDFKAMMVNSVSELRRAGLMIDTFGLDDIVPSTTQTSVSPSLHKPLSNPVTVLCNDIQLAMRKLHYTIYRGDIYKQVAKAHFTFQYLCSMKTFLHSLMGNEAFKDRLIQHIQRVLPIMSEPESSLMPQLKIERDLIEVNDGWLWSFSSGSFVQGIIPESQVRMNNFQEIVYYSFLKREVWSS